MGVYLYVIKLSHETFSTDTQINRLGQVIEIVIKPYLMGAAIVYRLPKMVYDENERQALYTICGYPIRNKNKLTSAHFRVVAVEVCAALDVDSRKKDVDGTCETPTDVYKNRYRTHVTMEMKCLYTAVPDLRRYISKEYPVLWRAAKVRRNE